jgi:hypothetical protein
MARKYPRCQKCPHAIDSHLTATDEYSSVRGCHYCECMEHRPAPPPPPSIPLTDDVLRQMIKLLETVHRGLTKAEIELARLARPAPAHCDIRIAYGALVDLIAILGTAEKHRHFPGILPDTTLAGVPRWVLEREAARFADDRGWRPSGIRR